MMGHVKSTPTTVNPASLPGAADDTSGLPRITIVLLTVAAAWLAITGVQQLKDIVAPLLLTLNLLIVGYPIQAALVRRGAPKLVGAMVNGLVVFAILVAFFGALAWALTMLVQEIPQYSDRFQQLYQQSISMASRFGVSEQQLQQQLQGVSPSNIMGFLTGALSGLSGAVGLFVVAVTIIFVSLIDSIAFPQMMRAARHRHPEFADGLTAFGVGVRRYWVVTTIFGLIVAAIDVAALLIIGVPLALVWGVLSFLTNFIPNIGFILGLVPPVLMALLTGGPMDALWVLLAYSVINFFIQSVIQPKFNGEAIGVNATVSLLSLLFWAWVLGPLGALLALPATLLAKTLLLDHDPRVHWLNAFVAADPTEAAPELRDIPTDSPTEGGGAHVLDPKELDKVEGDGRTESEIEAKEEAEKPRPAGAQEN